MDLPGRECAICAHYIPFAYEDDPKKRQEDGEPAVDQGAGEDCRPREFPPNETLQICSKNHAIDACYFCLDQYVSVGLDTRGAAACGAMDCLHPDCDHKYTFDEIKQITTPATFSRYDELLTRKAVTEQPNFRWCLRSGCGAGTIYDPGDSLSELTCQDMAFELSLELTQQERLITCSECGFEMCFVHQVPWRTRPSTVAHQGQGAPGPVSPEGCQGCKDDLLNRGEETSEAWIAKNTKECPGPQCNVDSTDLIDSAERVIQRDPPVRRMRDRCRAGSQTPTSRTCFPGKYRILRIWEAEEGLSPLRRKLSGKTREEERPMHALKRAHDGSDKQINMNKLFSSHDLDKTILDHTIPNS
ncbi:hypothetical protein J7T55_013751 [Diaporthe amygdali]|uniref:uncharacterized protein n=1 Tax=Phomopsis amygdali TaxID=1214568 RepID=UPI0022FE5268|nr:uncharacterized protein J7T55_013751 [Diaporthe amygdali]KAJ0119548.1 hypothetical protein J7T55_013751 [Diaporthe amygdali]